MNQQPDLISDLEALTEALGEALARDDYVGLMAILEERERVIAVLVSEIDLNEAQAGRVALVVERTRELEHRVEEDKTRIESGLIDLYSARKGRRAYRRSA